MRRVPDQPGQAPTRFDQLRAILERADVDGMVERAVERRAGRIERAVANIEETIALALEQVADRPWTDPIDRLARRLARKRRPPR